MSHRVLNKQVKVTLKAHSDCGWTFYGILLVKATLRFNFALLDTCFEPTTGCGKIAPFNPEMPFGNSIYSAPRYLLPSVDHATQIYLPHHRRFAIAFASASPLPQTDVDSATVCNMLYFLVAADTLSSYSLLEGKGGGADTAHVRRDYRILVIIRQFWALHIQRCVVLVVKARQSEYTNDNI
ncbi:hypothetical protein BT96DRAFT_997686 [Gymnopus androsaceus JB14]|uniref:Uncharacterized protein n=1 Tax=Gymnopus androsaceus JB14 TaxID=1447944 RepID=A0A6A4HAP5_9AGAR|nr:hypothetical protein BT96DRAFT_997686 [Gymnopus androsaceus JB14]